MDVTNDLSIRIFLAVFFTAIAAFYTLRLLLARHKGPLLFVGGIGSAHWWGHISFRAFRLLIWGVCVLRVFYPSVDRYLGVCPAQQLAVMQWTGAVMLVLGFALAVAGHFNLRQAWRSGIDPAGPAALITDHLYRFSRNPMYIGVILAQLGFVLALPSVFSLVCLIAGVWAILNQVRLEERHLKQRFERDYDAYVGKVRRWL